jgi:hypothetical protein
MWRQGKREQRGKIKFINKTGKTENLLRSQSIDRAAQIPRNNDKSS